MLEVRLLGKFEVKRDAKAVTISSRPAQSLFAYLILSAGTAHRREKLAGMLWPDSLEETARDNLRHALWRVRKALESASSARFLQADDLSISFKPDADYWLDVSELKKLNEIVSIEELIAVLSEYQGELLPGFYDEWVIPEREHLHSVFEHQMARLLSLLQDETRWRDILDWAERWIKLGQKPEPAYRALMIAYAAKGEMSNVAVTYERCVKSLLEWGIEPSEQTKTLFHDLKSSTPTRTQRTSSSLPSGTVTFLLTDIEGSTRLAREYSSSWEKVHSRHHEILREAIEQNNGVIFQIIGDAFCAAFHTAGDAIRTATKSQIDLHAEPWEGSPVKVRMAIHTGKAEIQNGEYHSYLTLSRVQRLMSAGHGGQVLISAATQELLLEDLPEDVSLRDLGERRLKDLIHPEHIYQMVHGSLPVEFPPLKTLDSYRHNLPTQLTSFIGREKEIEKIKQAISNHRLVTLTGMGSTGKTRLSLQVATDLLEQFPHGVWFVELAPLTEPDLIPQTILSTLGVPEQAGRTHLQVLLDYLRGKKLLLILDNCEHLIEACARVVEKFASHTLDFRTLSTSREALGVTGELIWHVPSLTLPNLRQLPAIEQLSQYEAVQLFIERASLVQPHFLMTNENAPAVAQVCVRLDGIPLAIELAAARVRALSVEQIAKRLDDRFRLLTGGSRTAFERHQTLRATIDWSYNLLSGDEKLLLLRLSIFVGGWTFEAAEQVCVREGDDLNILDLLTHLVDKSLVILDGSRYRMLETTRQYAREKLLESKESETLRDQHLSFYLNLAEELQQRLDTSERLIRKKQLDADYDNFRAALEWSLSELNEASKLRAEKGVRLATALRRFWHFVGYHQEGRAWLEKALAVHTADGSESTVIRARTLYAAGYLAFFQGDFPSARSYFENSVAIYRKAELTDQRDLAAALSMLAATRLMQSDDLSLARSLSEESVTICRSLGSAGKWDLGLALFWNGLIASGQGDYATARACEQESRAIYQKVGNPWEIAAPLAILGSIATQQGDYNAARTYFDESLRLNREGEDRWGIAAAIGGHGDIALALGDYAAASVHYEESLIRWREIGVRHQESSYLLRQGIAAIHLEQHNQAAMLLLEWLSLFKTSKNTFDIALSLAGLSVLAAAQNQLARAARLLGAAEAIVASMNSLDSLDRISRTEYDRIVARTYSQIDRVAFAVDLVEGSAMTLEQGVEFALKEASA